MRAAGANAIELTAFLMHHIEGHFGMRTSATETAAVAANIVRWWRTEPPADPN